MATAFLPDVLGSAQIRIQAAFGVDPRSNPSGWTWTDITADVMQDNGRTIDIQIGRSPESATAPPAQCTLAVNNSTGNYTQFSPASIYYPNVREGTPIEVQLFISGTWYTRFLGFVKSFAPQWDTTGNYAIAVITAYGVTRRLTQGSAPFRSPLYRAIALGLTAFGVPLAYWPLEDGQYSTSGASAIAGQPDMAISGAVQFAQDVGPAGSDNLADFSSGGTGVGTVTSPKQSAYRVEAAIQFPVIPLGENVIALRILFSGATVGAIQYLDLTAAPNSQNGITALIYQVGNPTPSVIITNVGVENAWHWISIDFAFSGSGYGLTVTIDGNGTSDLITSLVGLDQLTSVVVNPTGVPDSNAPSVGHVVVWPQANSLSYAAYLGNISEDPSTRMARLCTEQGENITIVDAGDPSIVTMGVQGLKSFIDLIRECEASDAGYLYDGLDNGMDYQKLNGRYNIAALITLDASIGQLQPPFAPTSDDLGRVNNMTVNRTNGGTAIAIDSTSPLGTGNVGTYDNSITVGTDSDGYLAPRASWEVAKGTFNGFRYPTLSLDLRTIPIKATDWITVLPGSPIAVTLPYAAQLPPAKVGMIVEGWTEHLSRLIWTVNPLNCVPQDTYQVATYASAPGPVNSKFDAENSTVGTGFNTTALSASIASATGTVLWDTNSAEFPFDINIAGERITVSAISGASSPQTFTFSARSVNGIVKSHLATEAVHLWTIAHFAL